MKSIAQVCSNLNVGEVQVIDRKTHVITEIEKQFNDLFFELKPVFPALTTVVKTQKDLDVFKKQWLLAFAENGITTVEQFEMGMKIARKQSGPFIPSPGQFVLWCKEGSAQSLGLPTVTQIMKEFHRYNADRLDYDSPELFPWSKPIMYWIVTSLRKSMMQFNQSEFEVEKKATHLLEQWANRLSRGGTVPEIRVQIADKPKRGIEPHMKYQSPTVTAMFERVRSRRNGMNGN